MNNCFFGLLRSYLRVDNVLVRIMDTRIFHMFGTNYIFREFQVKENTFDELKLKGFKLTSDWSLAHNQSDTISQLMDVTYVAKDKIIFEEVEGQTN